MTLTPPRNTDAPRLGLQRLINFRFIRLRFREIQSPLGFFLLQELEREFIPSPGAPQGSIFPLQAGHLCDRAVFYTDATAQLTGNTLKRAQLNIRRLSVKTKVRAHKVHSAILHNHNKNTSLKCTQTSLVWFNPAYEQLHTALYNVNVSTLKANSLVLYLLSEALWR